jgi:hypothetical protein
MNGVEVKGSSREFEQIGEAAVAWEKGTIDPRKVPCVKEEPPKVCSGAYNESVSPQLISNYNIVPVTEIRIV